MAGSGVGRKRAGGEGGCVLSDGLEAATGQEVCGEVGADGPLFAGLVLRSSSLASVMILLALVSLEFALDSG